MSDENPYQSPESSDRGEYDWSLAKRMFIAGAALMFAYLVPATIVTWRSFQRPLKHETTILEQVKCFMFDWKDEHI